MNNGFIYAITIVEYIKKINNEILTRKKYVFVTNFGCYSNEFTSLGIFQQFSLTIKNWFSKVDHKKNEIKVC